MNYGQEFLKYSKSIGLSTTTTEAVLKHQSSSLYDAYGKVLSSSTPYIIEERPMHVTQMDVFSRLMAERMIFLSGVVDDRMCDVVQAQLLFLDSADSKAITLHINSPGGSVSSGLSMIDVMDYIKSDIATVNMGNCCSMGSVLLAAGTKGMRSTLRFSKVMVHRSSGGAGGHIEDAEITWKEWQKVDKILFELLSEYTGQTSTKIKKDAARDKWFDAQESVDYGLVDNIITKKGK